MTKTDEQPDERTEGWFIALKYMSGIAQAEFVRMMNTIKHGGQVDVVARVDGREYRWECDGLKYADFIAGAPKRESSDAEIDAGFWEGEFKTLVRAAVDKMAELGHVVDPPESMIGEAKYRLSKIYKSRKINDIEGGK